jgi:hypothetical protein
MLGRLIAPLTAGRTYCVTLYANLCEGADYAVKNIEVYLDDGSVITGGQLGDSCFAPRTWVVPQVSAQMVITDTANWVKIQGSFIANGTERFITIGNFKDKAHTTYQIRQPTITINPTSPNYTADYLIDDISVMESSLLAYAGSWRY